MRYQGLLKLGKNSYNTSFSLIEKLNITQKEAILLQQIEFNNKKSEYLSIPKTILAQITHMSRGHLYKSLSRLKKLNLIIENENGICVTESYLAIKKDDDKVAFSAKIKKIAKNVAGILEGKALDSVACDSGRSVACGDSIGSVADKNKNKDISPFVSLKAQHEDRNSFNIINKVTCENKSREHDDRDTINITSKGACRTSKIDALHSLLSIKSKGARDNIDLDSTDIQGKDTSPFTSLKAWHEDRSVADKISVLMPQNSHSFFMTKVSQNATKVSQKMTPYIHYKNKETFSLSLQDKENIYFSRQKDEKSKSLILRDKIKLLLKDLNNLSIPISKLHLPKELCGFITERFSSMLKASESVKMPQELKTALESKNLSKEYLAFANNLNLTGLFFHKNAKKAFIEATLKLIESEKITRALEYSKNNEKLWITKSSDSIGRKYLKEVWGEMLKSLNTEIKNEELKFLKSLDKESLFYALIDKHGEKIQEFINFRAKKGRNFNESALCALYATLGTYFENGKDVESIINQSIHRDYNWVFPLTHKHKSA